MLLAAVLLIIGFISLAGLVSVAQRLGEETLQEKGQSIGLEADRVRDGIEELIRRHVDLEMQAIGTFDAAMDRHLEQIEAVQARHGFIMRPPPLPGQPPVAGPYIDNDCVASNQWVVAFVLADADTSITVRVTRTC